jgi:uncharacterized membrane protein
VSINQNTAAPKADAKRHPPANSPDMPQFLDLTLYPQRSLKPEHAQKLLLGLGILCGLASLRFLAIGAWPVVVFLLFDILAIGLAFWISYRRGRAFETIQLNETDLIISHSDPKGRLRHWRFEPYWVKISMGIRGPDKNILEVSHHDKSVELGNFLTPAERRKIKALLCDALERWRAR